jgi:hypothetical protein
MWQRLAEIQEIDMRNLITNVSLATVIIASLMLITVTSPAEASKEPGESSGGDGVSTGNTVFIVAGVAVIAGVTIWLITKGNDDKGEDQEEEDSETDASGSVETEHNLLANNEFATECQPVLGTDKKLPVSPFVGVSRDETITVGLSFSF